MYLQALASHTGIVSILMLIHNLQGFICILPHKNWVVVCLKNNLSDQREL